MMAGVGLITMNDAMLKWVVTDHPLGETIFVRGMFALIPVLFLNGGLISGTSAAIQLSAGRQSSELLSKLGRLVGGLVLLELGLIAIELITLLNGDAEGVQAATAMPTLMASSI